MAISFLSSSLSKVDVFLSFDSSVELNDEQRTTYLTSGVFEGSAQKEATKFTLKALSPNEREDAEMKAGSFTRPEFGRLLWIEATEYEKSKAKCHHARSEEEKRALSSYQAYLNRV